MSDKRKRMRKETTFGDEVLHGLEDLLGSIDRGEAITIRDVTLELEPGGYDAEAVRITRQKLGVSQAVFAKLLAVKVKTVQSWEQGEATPSGMARRVLDDVNQDPQRWLAKLVQTKTMKTKKRHCPA